MLEQFTSFNLRHWVSENKDQNGKKKRIWDNSEFWAFVTTGPNDRKVFHINPCDEIFQQLEGELQLFYTRPDNKLQIKVLAPGDLFLLPAGAPHSPRRVADSCTLVITAIRSADAKESWIWYCEHCHTILHKISIEGRRMGEPVQILTETTQLLKNDIKLRTCSQCGHCSQV